MKCSYCNENAIFYRKISNERLCKVHFSKTIEKKIRKTVSKFNLFTPKDKVAVGLSGGKDSLVLLYNILKLQSRYPKSPKVEAILIDEGIKGYRNESIEIAQNYCNEWDVKLHIIRFKDFLGKNLDEIIPNLKDLRINACTICGTSRRYLLNYKAREIGANKLAIGHNLDDQVQTYLANIIRNDMKKIGTNPPYGNLDESNNMLIQRVKPLMEIPEDEITRYCYYNNISIQTNPCPYVEGFSILRKKIQNFLNELEKHSAEIKYNLYNANIFTFEIFNKNLIKSEKEECAKLNNQSYIKCSICGEACSPKKEHCYFCELRKQLGLIN